MKTNNQYAVVLHGARVSPIVRNPKQAQRHMSKLKRKHGSMDFEIVAALNWGNYQDWSHLDFGEDSEEWWSNEGD